MSVIRINDDKRKTLKVIASIEGKSMGSIVSELIEDYISENKQKIRELSERENLNDIMKMSKEAFREWDNHEDEVYNKL